MEKEAGVSNRRHPLYPSGTQALEWVAGGKAGPGRDQCNLQSAFHTVSAAGLSPGSCYTHTHTCTLADNIQPDCSATSTFFTVEVVANV